MLDLFYREKFALAPGNQKAGDTVIHGTARFASP
jgi:hypothetical protein